MTNMVLDKKVLGLLIAFNLVYFNVACAGNSFVNEREQTNANIDMTTQNKPNKKTNENIVADGNNSPQLKTNKNKAAADSRDYLITNTNLGKIRIGMQMKEIKKIYPNSKFKIVTSPLDSVTSEIEVTQNDEKLFFFTTENFSEVEEIEMPAETDKIFFLVIDNPHFATAQGIKVGQTFGDAEKAYGKPKFFSETSSDFISFENTAVESIVFYSIHDKGEKSDKKYSPNAKITHIGLGKSTK